LAGQVQLKLAYLLMRWILGLELSWCSAVIRRRTPSFWCSGTRIRGWPAGPGAVRRLGGWGSCPAQGRSPVPSPCWAWSAGG